MFNQAKEAATGKPQCIPVPPRPSNHWAEPDGAKTDFVRVKPTNKKSVNFVALFCLLLILLGSAFLLLRYYLVF